LFGSHGAIVLLGAAVLLFFLAIGALMLQGAGLDSEEVAAQGHFRV